MADGEYKISLGITLDDNDLANQIRGIRTNERIRIGVELNDDAVQRQITNIRRQIQELGNIRINIGGNLMGGNNGNGNGGSSRGISGFFGNINNNISQITTTANNATNTIQRLRQTLASARFDNASIDLVTRHLEQMNMAVTNVTSRIRNNNLRLNITGTDELGRTVTVLKEINLATGEITNIGKNISQSFGRTREEINQTNSAYREMKSLIKEMSNTSIKINSAREAGKEFGALEIKLAALNARYDELEANFAGSFDVNQTRNLSNEWNKVAHDVNIANEAITNARTELARGIELKLNNGTFDNDISNINSKFDKLSNQSREVQIAIDNVGTALNDMRIASADGNIEALIAANERYEKSLKDVKNQLDINARAEKDAAAAQKLDDSRNAFMSNIDAWLTKNSAATKKFGAQMLELKAQGKSCDQVTLNHLRTEFKRLDKEAEAAGLKMQTFGDRLKSQFSRYSQYFSVASLMIYATQGLKDMFNQVVAIDSAMTELKKVTDETDASYNKFLTNAASRSKEIGTTIDGLVQSTADFARLGYEFKDATGLAEVANIYAVVGDEIEGVEQATESLISTMAAFKDEAVNVSNTDFAMGIVDKFNEIGNKFAISSGGIGESLKRSASSLDAANNTIDESIALITAANTVVQNPDKVGRLLPTIKMAISVKLQRWTRPRKDFISIFDTYQLGRVCVFLV